MPATADAAAQQTDQHVANVCRLAFEAEHYSQFHEALDQHGRAVVALEQLADDAGLRDDERKRVARKQARFHAERRQLMQQIVSGQRPGLDVALPSSISAHDSLTAPAGRLSLDEMLLSRALKPFHDQAQATAAKGVVANPRRTLAIFLANAQAYPGMIKPEIQHMFAPGPDGATLAVAPLTPTLDMRAPDYEYHVHLTTESVAGVGRWYYFRVKDAGGRQTLYVLQALKRQRFQASQTTLARAAEFAAPCVHTAVSPVESTGSRADGETGRQLVHYTASALPVVERPDRTKHVPWEPRRLAWGGRTFVWKQGASKLDSVLCEVASEWAQPGSKTGKMLDECFEPVVHVRSSPGFKRPAVVTFRFGMGADVLFRELVLASHLTCSFILAFGHDD